ncbi:acyltransferase family protein [Nonomuraea soli]|uniref:Peptidoglycan/LPS O-acetylase OafA/YrhL n=1 Tax=Nonomuraea soli TaxID=1032476 RepID=A0A7W0CHD4_9ACTN|nr:acyltransferase [Nonomuraea soli]MBA2891184.1 peptidoglycan/LPS O-acetylase OafA/YrhL [Nonomuraea soli]
MLTAASPTAPARTSRLAWLDALRGVAALVVVFEHAIDPLLGEVPKDRFAFGTFGVMVFFLVSGYIVPASLERRGSVRGFWISRVMRLYPLWAVCVAGSVLLAALGWVGVHEWWGQRPVAMAVGHVTMLQDLLNRANLVNVLWTLSFEMVFYLLVTALFTLGLQGRSVTWALALGGAAVAGAVAGLPWAALSAGGSGRMLAATLAVVGVLGAGLGAVLAGGARVRRAGALVLIGALVVVLGVNQEYPYPHTGLLILATMFAGTALWRAESGQIPWRRAAWTLLVPVAGVALALGWGLMPPGRERMAEALAVAAAWVTFAVAMGLRRRAVPAWTAWLGVVSYSLYLLHPLLLQAARQVVAEDGPLAVRLAVLAAAVAALLGLSALTWRWVEAPAQRLGRRWVNRQAGHPAGQEVSQGVSRATGGG